MYYEIAKAWNTWKIRRLFLIYLEHSEIQSPFFSLYEQIFFRSFYDNTRISLFFASLRNELFSVLEKDINREANNPIHF